MCCRINQEPGNFAYPTGMALEVHHIVDKGYRQHSGGHIATLPLCKWHHRGEPFIDCSVTEMAANHGPSLGVSKRAFILWYGTERELLAKVNADLSTTDNAAHKTALT